MPKMLGLLYTGHREEGISLMLFRSYKTVTISKRNPYRFTARDNVSQEAFNYYNSKCRSLGIKVATSPEELTPTSKATVRNQKLEAEIDQQVDVTKPVEEEVTPPAPPAEVAEEHEEAEVEPGQSTSSTDASQLAEMSDAELSEYLDMNYDRQGLKDLISTLGVDVNVGRKGESTLINELVSGHKDAVVAYLSSK